MRSLEAADGANFLAPAENQMQLQRQITPHRSTGAAIVSTFVDTQEDSIVDADRYQRMCGCWWTGNQRVLLLTAALFGGLTLVQGAAADMSKSEALLADCISMGVDTLTYMLHIFGEAIKGNRCHRPVQLVVPAISLGLLSFFTVIVLVESIHTLRGEQDLWGEADDDVDPWIVLVFAVLNIVLDFVSMLYFYWNAKQSGSRSVNMLAAFLLVGADFVRGFVCLFESLMIIGFGYNGTLTDAWSCVIVSVTILLGAAYGIYEWITDACDKPAVVQ